MANYEGNGQTAQGGDEAASDPQPVLLEPGLGGPTPGGTAQLVGDHGKEEQERPPAQQPEQRQGTSERRPGPGRGAAVGFVQGSVAWRQEERKQDAEANVRPHPQQQQSAQPAGQAPAVVPLE